MEHPQQTEKPAEQTNQPENMPEPQNWVTIGIYVIVGGIFAALA